MASRLIRDIYNIRPEDQQALLTIGNFDGVHLGHQHLLAKLVKKARSLGVPSMVMTFEPQPFEFFSEDRITTARLTRLREKCVAFTNCGVDRILVLKFNHHLANINASNFVTQIIHEQLNPTGIIVGDDFRFGYQRHGDIKLLEKMGAELGFTVEDVSTFSVDGERVSSTRVREALERGDHRLVLRLLGHPYSMLGRIGLGQQLGRRWGFPTANIYLHRKLTPILGVYTVFMHGIGDKPLPGVANVGVRPTIDGTRALLEVHLLDFNHEIYGHYVQVEFIEKLRNEIRYSNVELLKAQIARDVIVARNYFKKQGVI